MRPASAQSPKFRRGNMPKRKKEMMKNSSTTKSIEDRLDSIQENVIDGIIESTNEAEIALIRIEEGYILSKEEIARIKSMLKNIRRIKNTLSTYGI